MGLRCLRQHRKSHVFMEQDNGARLASWVLMILIVTPFAAGSQCAARLEQATGLSTHWAETLQTAVSRLRSYSYLAIVLDQFLLETEPGQIDAVFEQVGTGMMVQLSFGVSSMDRVVREVSSALGRRRREEAAARRAVEVQMRSELSECLTAVLLSCELALSTPGVPEKASDKIRTIDGLARDMCCRLGAA